MKTIAPLLKPLQYAWAAIAFTLKQLAAQRELTLALLLGLVTAISITMSLPIYADAVYQQVLETEISSDPTMETGFKHAPFAFLFRYVGSWSGAINYGATLAVDTYLAEHASLDLDLPLDLYTRYYKTASMRMFSVEETQYEGQRQSLAYIELGSIAGLEQHISLLEGAYPENHLNENAVEVLVHENLANELGLQHGETYKLFESVQTEQGDIRVEIPIRIAAVWRPMDINDPFWFYNLSEFDSVLLVEPNTFAQHVLPAFNNEVDLALWYLVMDGSQIKSSDVDHIVGRINHTRQRAFNLLPGLRLDVSPLDRLYEFQRKSRRLTQFLSSFSVPILGMIMIFIGLVSVMAVQQRSAQIATMRSRGASYSQMVGMAAFEGCILGLASLAMGIPGAFLIAQAIGRTRSFLDFSAQTDLSLRLPNTALQLGAGMLFFVVAAQVLPVISASKYSIVSFKQTRTRQSSPAWWQRVWLDALLFIPVVYGLYLYRKPGAEIGGMPNDPFQNPLIVLLPALSIFGLILIALRVLPWIMKAIAWFANRADGVSLLLAARQLARMGNDYHAPLILLIFTLSLSTYTASMAQTLDHYLYDRNNYAVGSDVHLDETGELNTEALGSFFGGSRPNQSEEPEESEEPTEPRWFFLPVSEHLRVSGVQAAARIRSAQARIDLPVRSVQGLYLGIDRVDFSQVSFWREDFAPEPLGALMNRLALTPNGVLIPASLLESQGLLPGDVLKLSVFLLGEKIDIDLRIVGVFNLFPTWHPEEGPLVVGNLDYLYEQAGMEFPYDVWLKTETGVDSAGIVAELESLGIIILNYRVSGELLEEEQLRPERQGLFGLLSIGFLILTLLTVLGFCLYALFSFRRRFIELGMLRALGLTAWQLFSYLILELLFLLIVGIGVGTALGVWSSHLFIPMLQMGSGPEAPIPPFIIQIDWSAVFQVYILFGTIFLAALLLLSILLLRMKIFEAIKMGEMV